MVFTTTAKVRLMTNIVIADVSDADVASLITEATAQMNGDINTRVVREKIVSIDDTRENLIDGSNTTYYVQNWETKFIGDANDTGTVTTADITVYQVDSSGTETELTVSTITADEGKFVLSSAPTSGVRLFVTYVYTLIDVATPAGAVSLAAALLTAAFCYEKINRGMSPQQVYGNVRFMRDMRAGNEYFQRYENEIAKINGEMGDFAEAEVF